MSALETSAEARTPFVLEVDAAYVGDVLKRIEKLRNWCSRNGIDAPDFAWGEDRICGYKRRDRETNKTTVHPTFENARDCGYGTGVSIVPIVKRSLTVTAARLAVNESAALVGVLSHVDGKVIPTVVRGETMPSDVLTRYGQCDHCQCQRRRSETFVIRDSEDRVSVVGRSCVSAHLGIDPKRLAAMLDLQGRIANTVCFDEEPRYMTIRHRASVEDIVTASIIAMRLTKGYVKAAQPLATSWLVWLWLDPPTRPTDLERDIIRDLSHVWSTGSEEIKAEASKALAWARSLPADSGDFRLSMKALAEVGFSIARTHGLAIFLAAAWMKENDSLPSGDRYEHTSALPDSDRVSVVSQILSVSGPFEGEYGPSWTVVGRAEHGWNWITQTTSRPFVDAAYEARSRREAIGMVGAVKRIEDDRRKPDAKIVRLTRCKTH